MKHALSRHIATMLAAAALVAPFAPAATATPSGAPAAATTEIKLGTLGYRGAVPSRWRTVAPETTKRLVQFHITDTAAAGAPAAPAAEVIVFYFGAGEGGTAQANIERWRGQFIGTNHTPVTPAVERFNSNGMDITTAELHGTYARGVGVGPIGTPRPDQTLLAAVIESPQGNLILQLFGDSATVARERDGFLAFVRSIAPQRP